MTSSASPSFHRPRRRGMALIIVLAIVALVAVLVVGFVRRAGTERISSDNYRTAASTRQLADTAVNIVQAQIDHATTQGPTHAWASQPGAIRRYSDGGGLELIYRLYSATSITAKDADELDNDLPPNDWDNSPAVWCDLNQPVTSTDSNDTTVTTFPILDPRKPGQLSVINDIEGFELDDPPGAQLAAGTGYQPAPMPVRWLYVLRDGQIVSPVGGGKTVTVTGASKDNPIVGRIAFWTDDESCKVNINTAANGTFWDTPRFNYIDERDTMGEGLALYQPTAGEYQRYPGHPAMTTLTKVFPSVNTTDLFDLLPRYTWGGSSEAKKPITSATPITKKTDRLYTSVSELLFDPNRDPNGLLTEEEVESAGFFVTAHSRAPELNLFGLPRIAVWPIHAQNSSQYRSTIDTLIAFCSTINKLPYYFTRSLNTSMTADITLARNKALLDYLENLTKTNIPGFGGSFAGKYGSADQHQILTDIFDYVRMTNLLDATVSVPYASNTFSSPNTGGLPGRGQVSPSKRTDWGTIGQGRFPRIVEASMVLVGMGNGDIPSLSMSAVPVSTLQRPTYAAGTPPDDTVAVQAFLLFRFFTPGLGYPRMEPAFTIQVSGLDKFTLNGTALGMLPSATSYIAAPAGKYSQYSSSGPGGGIIDFRVMMASRTLDPGSSVSQFPFYSNIIDCPYDSAQQFLELKSTTPTGNTPLTINLYNGNSTDPSELVQTYTIDFPAQKMPVPLVSHDLRNRQFGTSIVHAAGWVSERAQITDRVDTAFSNFWNTDSICPSYDSIFSMVLNGNWTDPRMLATPIVDSDAFTGHPNRTALALGTTHLAYSQRIGSGTSFTGATNGYLVPGSKAAVSGSGGSPAKPQLVSPTATNGVFTSTGAPGDWDNGVAHQPDGPYINKTDEGNVYIHETGGIPYFDSGQFNVTALDQTLFSANRQVPSPVVFGSISTGIKRNMPWQTLLFRPGPTNHPGEGSPKDHLLLDLFWMPVVEPYAISEPFSTAGKVNLNYQIVPFTYITRSTALRSVLDSEKVAQVPLNDSDVYKTDVTQTRNRTGNARHPLNLSDTTGTLRQFKEKFAKGEIFKSASEICDIFLVPNDKSWPNDSAARSDWYGNDFAMVGDNTRERPYADIYSRVTTKSNIYTVYCTVQSLKNPPSNPGQWNEDTGTISGEYRGATMLERYIDPNENLPDFATPIITDNLETYYKWRVVSDTQFAP